MWYGHTTHTIHVAFWSYLTCYSILCLCSLYVCLPLTLKLNKMKWHKNTSKPHVHIQEHHIIRCKHMMESWYFPVRMIVNSLDVVVVTDGGPRQFCLQQLRWCGRHSQGGSTCSEVTLSIESGGEGGVVECSRHGTNPCEWSHPGDTVFCLVWWQFTTQHVWGDVWLIPSQDAEG